MRAVRIYVAHHQADVVQMRGHCQRVSLAPGVGDHAAFAGQPVEYADLIQQASQNALYLFILAGGTVRAQKRFER